MATQGELDQARAAYHALVTGKSPEEVVDQNGEKVRFVRANANRLQAYINQLAGELGMGKSSRPLRPFF